MTPASEPRPLRYKYAPDGTPHPCESCDHWERDKAPKEWICNKAEIKLLTYPEVALIRSIGCASHTGALALAQLDALKELQAWRIHRMNGMLKKDVWIGWNEETDLINEKIALLQETL